MPPPVRGEAGRIAGGGGVGGAGQACGQRGALGRDGDCTHLLRSRFSNRLELRRVSDLRRSGVESVGGVALRFVGTVLGELLRLGLLLRPRTARGANRIHGIQGSHEHHVWVGVSD